MEAYIIFLILYEMGKTQVLKLVINNKNYRVNNKKKT